MGRSDFKTQISMTGIERHSQLKSHWRCPSNIALVKYWGKRDFQKPMNPSLSFTLQNAVTETSVEIFGEGTQKVEFYFEGILSDFGLRIEKYLEQLTSKLPWIKNFNFRIDSKNSFPHSAGIASSASSFGALALCLAELDFKLSGKNTDGNEFWQKASELARIGSGSACRSVFGGYTVWGHTPVLKSTSDNYAVPITEGVHPVFFGIRDAILLVDAGIKKVSSSMGHQLMKAHIFQNSRIEQANRNVSELYQALKNGNQDQFIEVVESEALSLHAMMMTSTPSFVLLKPNSLEIIDRIRQFREETGIPVCFTIDAGPNIHLLYFAEDEQKVKSFIENELTGFCENGRWIDDHVGNGPEAIPLTTTGR
jgi:diphosphomevalonate decarboxylase